MTITTNPTNRNVQRQFSRRPASSKVEAIATLGAGVGLAAYALFRRTWPSAAAGAAGGYLAYRGVAELRRPFQGRVRKAFTIARPPQEIYDFVRQPENWNRFLHAIRLQRQQERERERDGNSHFRLTVGERAGMDLSSRIQITDHRPGEYIAWASDEQNFEHRGVMHFRQAPGNRGTEVSVALEYKAPAGPIARSLAALVGWDPEQVVQESLRHLKQLVEAGEIPTTNGQSVGARGMRGAAMRVLYREGPTEDATQQMRLAGD
jgi:uncharacterized membrane protein